MLADHPGSYDRATPARNRSSTAVSPPKATSHSGSIGGGASSRGPYLRSKITQ